MISKKAADTVNNWLKTMQDGDKIICRGSSLIIYNGSGCELDSVDIHG